LVAMKTLSRRIKNHHHSAKMQYISMSIFTKLPHKCMRDVVDDLMKGTMLLVWAMQFCNNNCKPQTSILPIKNAFIVEFTGVCMCVCWRCSKASLWSSSWIWGPSFGCFYATTMLPMNLVFMVSIAKIVLK
jgi:hypothetical protein